MLVRKSAKFTGKIVEKVTLREEIKQYEDKLTEATVAENCRNCVPFLKLKAGCKNVSNIQVWINQDEEQC
jgi:hypothetical protein